jgi:hypothetical protein
MNDIVNYKKRKNTELFKSLERFDLDQTQNYIPIYTKLMTLNETNFNSVNLNHTLYITNVINNIEGNQNLYKCSLKNSADDQLKIKPKNVFCKMAPLLDPIRYLIGKYDVTDNSLMNLPSITSTASSVNSKLLDVNNSAYVDSLFSHLTSQLLSKHGFIHGIEFYGSFLSIKKNFKLNVFDDLDYLIKSDFFNKNKNQLFQIEDYSALFDDDTSKKNLPAIKIDATGQDCNFSIEPIEDILFNEVFDTSQTDDNVFALTTDNLKELSMETFALNTLSSHNSESIDSESSCSSRTSHTRESDSCGEDNSTEEWTDENSEDDEDDDISENECINVTFPKYPVQVICMEQCQDTLDNLMLKTDMDEIHWMSALMQIIMTLITYQKVFAFTHNDLHTNNIMYVPTDKKFIYYCFKNKYYRVPTFGKIFKIIDFGRGIYKYDGKLLCSDSFSFGGDAATQYNIEPYFNDKKPRLEPNYSFDLCRLACSMFDYLVDDMDSIKDLSKCDTITRIIVEWCLDDNGLNVLYKNNGADRYPDFKLYKMIARCVHKHTPQAQLERKEFNAFIFPKKQIPGNEKVINIDDYPSYV